MHSRTIILALLVSAMLGLSAPAASAAPDINTVLDLTFPVAGNDHHYSDTYWAARGSSREHKSTDILAPAGTPVHAAVGGTISWITGLNGSPPPYGYMITIRGDDGNDHGYVHLGTQDGPPSAAYAPGMTDGRRVERGQLIGYVGCSGNASCTDPHVHYDIEDPSHPAQDDDYDHFRYNPYPSLQDAEARGDVPGTSHGQPLTGDWDGDGQLEPGWWRGGDWSLDDGNGGLLRFRYGRSQDAPIVGDWDGDGSDDIGIIRDREWHLQLRPTGGQADIKFTYGRMTSGDLPLVGDWDGDGRDTIGIVRDGEWHLKHALAGGSADKKFTYGRVTRGDIPIIGDWDNDGRDTIGIVRDGEWHLKHALAGGSADKKFTYGRVTRGDIPIIGDWDNDGRDTIGIVRGGEWHLRDELSSGPATNRWSFNGR